MSTQLEKLKVNICFEFLVIMRQIAQPCEH